MLQKPGLYVLETNGKGRGVFTANPIEEGETIEVAHVIVIPKIELPIIHKTILHDYYFVWGEDMDECALCTGFGSLYNHEVEANATFILDFENKTIDFIAIKNINAGEEITINYNGGYGDNSPLWFSSECP
jgi:hypothetical protein